ncbi:MAG TPA: hypothetical protein PJ986_04135 [Gammaproteobacteria bacterium]|nr:hypothetical protein [Gammaproteobacteria bacterium]
MNDTSPPGAIAIHETAHALVVDGLTASLVALVELTGADSGRFEFTPGADAGERLLIAVAGGVGEQLVYTVARCVSRLDREQARDAIEQITGCRLGVNHVLEADPLYIQARARVHDYLAAHVDALCHAARHLDSHGRVTGYQLRALVRQFEEERLQAQRADLGRHRTAA